MCPLMILALEEEIQEKNFEFNLTLRHKEGRGAVTGEMPRATHWDQSDTHGFGTGAEAEGRETFS